ncbi:MAG: cation:proton antiporter [Novosphingobium sp.]|nr:cation:proton antiporter [Novosphingobium sp.]
MAGGIEHTTALSDALVILGAAGLVIPAFARLRITPVIGFILIGMLVGPYGLGSLVGQYPWLYHITITDPQALAPFAEYGIILLLFSIGLELSFNRLWGMRRLVFGLGAMELIASAAFIALALLFLGTSWQASLILGLAIGLSSTALVLPIAGTSTPVGKAALAMLLFEDIALVPIIFLTGAIAPFAAEEGWGPILRTLAWGFVVVTAMLVVGRYALPRLFAQAARTKSPELFLAASLLVVIVASLATGAVGLSPIMGALLAGLLIAETEYHGEVEAITAPFKGLALGVFLLTIGMGIDFAFVRERWVELLLAIAAVLALKAIVTAVLLKLMGAGRGTATETGILMASPSETTLIVLTAALAARLINTEAAQFWQIATAIGLTVTPLLAAGGKLLARRLEGGALPASDALIDEAEKHAVVIGFGRVGRLVGEMLTEHGQRFVAVDSNPGIIQQAAREGFPVVYGDAVRGRMMDRLGLDKAQALVVTMDEPVVAARIVKTTRQRFPDLPIIVRARDVAHAAELYRLGASHAVPETLESSLQLSEAVLVDIGFAMGPVIASIHEKRDEFRAQIMQEGELAELPKLKSASLRERQT